MEKDPRPSGSASGDGVTGRAPASTAGHMRRALLVSDSELLVTGVTTLFENNADLEISVAMPEDESALLKEIRRNRPHVIILDEATKIVSPLRLLSRLTDFTHVRLVRVSSRDGLLNVYDRKNSLLNQLSDFISAVTKR